VTGWRSHAEADLMGSHPTGRFHDVFDMSAQALPSAAAVSPFGCRAVPDLVNIIDVGVRFLLL
jgi:hypothetical protein